MNSNTGNVVSDIYRGCYGAKAKPSEIQEWVKFSIKKNIERQEVGLPRCTLNVWGAPGTSKTSIIKSLKNEKLFFEGKEQNIEVIDIPLAQIEELGDVLGFPVEEIEMANSSGNVWIKAVNSLIESYLKEGYVNTGSQRTTYAPPSWVPTKACPGVILFDDGNRASQRIMRGLMQLVQDYKTIAWSIPKGWTIVFTGNPDNRYNQVTSMDTAQLTRMKHITLEVDAKEWSIWAQENGIDQRGINFVLRYPEMMIGKERTNPRSLTEFFYSLKNFPELSDKTAFHLCMIEAYASLDDETVAVLGTFLTRDSELVITPETILNDTETAEKQMKELLDRKEPRIDIASVTMDRLVAYLLAKDYEFQESHLESFKRWMLSEVVPKDLVFSSMNRIVNSGWKYGRKFVTGKELLNMVLDMFKKE